MQLNFSQKKCVLNFFIIFLFLIFSGIYLYGLAPVFGVLICLFFLSIYYGMIVYALKQSGCLEIIKQISKKDCLLLIISSTAIIALISALINREEFIYCWDSSGSWIRSLTMGNTMLSNPVYGLHRLYSTVCNNEYNVWCGLLMALPLKILGGTRLSYIISMVIMFVLPTVFIYTITVQYIQNKCNLKYKLPLWLIFVFFVSFVAFFRPTLWGYLDCACILLVACLVMLSVTVDYKEFSLKKSLIIIFLILHLALMRRSYCFWIIAFAIGMVIWGILDSLKLSGQDRKTALIGYLKNCSLIVGLCSIVLVVFFKDYLINILQANISFAYGAWGRVRSVTKYITFFKEYGLCFLLLSCASILIVCIKNSYILKKTVVLQLSSLLYLILSNLILGEGFSTNGFYWISGQLCFLSVLGIVIISNLIASLNLRNLFMYSCVLCFCLNCMIGYGLITVDTNYMLQVTKCPIRYRSDINEIKLLGEHLKKLSKNDEKVYVIASSPTFNDELLRNYNLPNLNTGLNVCVSAHVDLRDGFYTSFFDSDIIILADPVQLQLLPEDQRVITVLYDFMNSEMALKYYKEQPEIYNLDGGVIARVYVKKKALDNACLMYVKSEFEKYYSDYADLFSNRIDNYMSERDERGTIFYERELSDLTDFLSSLLQNDSNIIMISAKDEASSSLTQETIQTLQNLGLNFDLANHYRWSYLAVVDAGNVVYESMSDEKLEYELEIDGNSILMQSAGFDSGNMSSIKIDGLEYALNQRGLNVVVYDKKINCVVDSVRIDTHKDNTLNR